MVSVVKNVGAYVANGVDNGAKALLNINPLKTAQDMAVGAFNPLHNRPSSQERAKAARLSFIFQDQKEKINSLAHPSQRAIAQKMMEKADKARKDLKRNHIEKDVLHAGRNLGTPLTMAAATVNLIPGGAIVATPLAVAALVVPWASHAATIGREAARSDQPQAYGRVSVAVKDLFKAIASSFGVPVALNAAMDLI